MNTATDRFLINLAAHLDGKTVWPVVRADTNEDAPVPRVHISSDGSDRVEGMPCHYRVSCAASVVTDMSDDGDNETGDEIAAEIEAALHDRDALFHALNKPDAGPDRRARKNSTLHELLVSGSEFEPDGRHNVTRIVFDAWIFGAD